MLFRSLTPDFTFDDGAEIIAGVDAVQFTDNSTAKGTEISGYFWHFGFAGLGIWENVDEAELDDVFAEADNEVQTTVDNIEDLLLSRQPENLDNYTLAVIFVNKVYQNPEKRKRIKKIVMITVIVVIAAIVIGVDRKSTRLNSSHTRPSRMPSSA